MTRGWIAFWAFWTWLTLAAPLYAIADHAYDALQVLERIAKALAP